MWEKRLLWLTRKKVDWALVGYCLQKNLSQFSFAVLWSVRTFHLRAGLASNLNCVLVL